MAHAAAKTSIGPIALIAVEQSFPNGRRVITDNLAYRMLPASSRLFVRLTRSPSLRDWVINASEKSQPGVWGGLLCRKRYIDDRLKESSRQIQAVVNLGAGFDTRCYRLPELSGTPIWEIDQPEIVEAKESRLQTALGAIPINIRLVPMDFDLQDLGTVLGARDYLTTMRTFFIMEAVTQYLTEEGMRKVFDFLAKVARGSRLAFTYVRKDFLDGENLYGWETGYKRFVTRGVWHYALEPKGVPTFLAKYGWKVLEDKGYDELAEECLKPFRREVASTAVERMVCAEKL